MKKLIAILTAKCIDKCRFVDKVNGRCVRLYKRRNGTTFMAHSKFDAMFFLVEKK